MEEMLSFLRFLFVFCISLGVSFFVLSGERFPDPDSFYHIKMAELLTQDGFTREFSALPFTTLGDAFADHHFLYHVFLIPFVLLFGSFTGGIVATAFLAAGAITMFYALLRSYSIRFPLFFTIGLISSGAFLFRIHLTKTSALSLIFVFLVLWAMQKSRPWFLFFLSALFVYTYGGWPVFGLIAGAFLIAQIIGDKVYEKHPFHSWCSLWFWRRIFHGSLPAWQQFFSAVTVKNSIGIFGGLLTGLSVNPYFPKNILFYWEQIVEIAIRGYEQIGVGAEWYPYPFPAFFTDNLGLLMVFFFVFAVMSFAVFTLHYRGGRTSLSEHEIRYFFSSLILSACFFLLAATSRRHIEYFIPFAIFSLALFFTFFMDRIDKKSLVMSIRLRLGHTFRFLPELFGSLFILCALLICGWSIFSIKQYYDRGFPQTTYQSASAYLRSHTNEGDIIFHDNWGDFPMLFYWNSDLRYIVGLDPTFFYRKDPTQYFLWKEIATGQKKDRVARTIIEQFNAFYVFVRRENVEMISVLDSEKSAIRVYTDHEAIIFALLPNEL